MFRRNWFTGALLTATALFSMAALSGCATRTSYRVYDPGYRDYHSWGPGETVYYRQWAVETHHENREYRRLKHEEQRNYWNWRHSHPDRDHDHH